MTSRPASVWLARPHGARGRAVRSHRLPRLVTALAISAAVAGCGSSSAKQSSTSSKSRSAAIAFRGLVNQTPGPVAALRLRDSLGRTVDIRQYAGKAVLVTFIYTHCPDVCPLIVGNLHSVQAQLGPASAKLQIIAVSTDPRGDTPSTVKRFLTAHEMTGRMEYLLGTQPQLGQVWKAWGVVAKRAKQTPEFVEHSALIYGVSASGKLLTLYAANFKPADVAHDVPLLAQR